MEQAQISREEFNTWKDDKVTQFIFSVLQERRDSFTELLTQGATLAPDGIQTALVVGRIQSLNEVLLSEYEEPEEPAQYGY